ncbi:MAG: efflux RND transporter periplasmic adaptor subunit [Burkholderiales bacterium]
MKCEEIFDSVKRFGWSLPAACALLSACDQHAPVADVSAAALLREGASIAVPATSPLRKALQVDSAAETTFERPISVPGVIEADPARLVKIVPPVGGRIERVYKGLGDAVRAGEPLLTLDSADLAQATSDANKAQAALALADHALTRQRDLAAAEISARKDLEQAQSDRAQAQSEARRAQSRLSQLGSALGRGNGREYTLTAPISGHVIDLTGAQGGFWNDTNAPLMTVADLSKVWLTASVQEKDLAAVFVGQQALIALNAYPGEPLTGRVAYVGQVLDADTRTVKVRVALDNAAGRLRPGMFASAVFSGVSHEAITVPASALIQDGFNTRVFVERAPWTFEARNVKTGAQIGSQVEIAAGLKAGERIVVKDGVLLND